MPAKILVYSTIANPVGVALNGATIKPDYFISMESADEVKTPIQFGIDGVYKGKETASSGSPFWFRPADQDQLGGSTNGQFPNGLSAGSHTISVKDRENAVIATATFTIG